MAKGLAPWLPGALIARATPKGRGEKFDRLNPDDAVVQIVEYAIFAVRAYLSAHWGELLHCLSAIAQTVPQLPRDLAIDPEAVKSMQGFRAVRYEIANRVKAYAAGRPVRHLALDDYDVDGTGLSMG